MRIGPLIDLRRQPKIDAAILERGAGRDVTQRLAVVDFGGDARSDQPAQTEAHARNIRWVGCRAFDVPTGPKIVERDDLHGSGLLGVGEIRQAQRSYRDAQLAGGKKRVVGYRQELAIAAHRVDATKGELLDREERTVGELEIRTDHRVPVLINPADILRLPQP